MEQRALPQWRRIATPIALAIVSLAAAIVLWVAVTDAENPNRVDVFSGAIEVRAVNVPEGLGVASIREASVSIRVSAPEDEFSKLTAADFRAEVDLTGVRQPTSEQVVLARVASTKEVSIVEVTPTLVTVDLEPVATKLVPVQSHLIGSPPQGYNLSGVDPNPATVRVTGASSLVQLVAGATADVNLTGLRVTLQQQLALTPVDARGASIRGVAIEPETADFRINVTQQQVTLAMTVVASVQGTVADGFNLIGVSTDPPVVPVSGPLEVLQATSFLTTEPVDASGLKADAARTVRLRLPQGLSATRESVTVRLKVVAAPGETTFSVAPQVTGLADGLKSTLQTPSINVRVGGDQPTLRGVSATSIKATISADGLAEGVHVLRPTVTVPEGLQIVSVDPQQVVLVLRR